LQTGPSDAAVIRPKLNSYRGVAIGCGLAPHIADPYEMALAAIDEAIRNVVAVGGDPERTAILDNFCWPSVDDERTMGALVRTCEACYDAAMAYGIPFISGKDSLHNQFTNQETGEVIRIPNTLLISAISIVEDVRKCVTMDLKKAGNEIAIVSPEGSTLSARATLHRSMAAAIRRGLIVSCHDCSEGGVAVAAAEMCIASGLGLDLGLDDGPKEPREAFGESPAWYLVEYKPEHRDELDKLFRAQFDHRGTVLTEPRLKLSGWGGWSEAYTVEEMTKAWRGTLDW
jgi:phosphoribosylformylglycinamidine synthase